MSHRNYAWKFVFCHTFNDRRLPRNVQGHRLALALCCDGCPGQAHVTKTTAPNLLQHLVLHRSPAVRRSAWHGSTDLTGTMHATDITIEPQILLLMSLLRLMPPLPLLPPPSDGAAAAAAGAAATLPPPTGHRRTG